MLAQHRSGVLPARLVPALAALPPVRRLELACDPHWPPQVLAGVGALSALPLLAALRVDACAGAGGTPDAFWTGAAAAAVALACCLCSLWAGEGGC